jgi:hypothetical protein
MAVTKLNISRKLLMDINSINQLEFVTTHLLAIAAVAGCIAAI